MINLTIGWINVFKNRDLCSQIERHQRFCIKLEFWFRLDYAVVVEEFDFFYRKGSENEFLNNYIEYKPQFSKQI